MNSRIGKCSNCGGDVRLRYAGTTAADNIYTVSCAQCGAWVKPDATIPMQAPAIRVKPQPSVEGARCGARLLGRHWLLRALQIAMDPRTSPPLSDKEREIVEEQLAQKVVDAISNGD